MTARFVAVFAGRMVRRGETTTLDDAAHPWVGVWWRPRGVGQPSFHVGGGTSRGGVVDAGNSTYNVGLPTGSSGSQHHPEKPRRNPRNFSDGRAEVDEGSFGVVVERGFVTP